MFSSNMIFELKRDKSVITKYFANNSLQFITICSNGFNLSLRYLKILINDKEFKIYNTINGKSIGNIKFPVHEYNIDNNINKIEIRYRYINKDNLTEKRIEDLEKFPEVYDSECYLICEYLVDYSELIKNDNKDKFEIRNSFNDKIVN